MKKIFYMIIVGIVMVSLTGCGNNQKEEVNNNSNSNSSSENEKGNNEMNSDSNSLVLYFSATGTTKEVSEKLASVTNSDIIEIIPKDKYTADDLDYNKEDTRANREMNDLSSRPEIQNKIDIEKYDVIYIGYPIWWGTNPRIILTLLDTVSFDGKKVALFCTSGGSGIEKSVTDLKSYNSEINWLDGKRFYSNVSEKELSDWIKELDL